MSANNFILLKEYEDSPKFRIFVGDADEGVDTESVQPNQSSESLEDAMNKCEGIENEYQTEYGIIFRGLNR